MLDLGAETLPLLSIAALIATIFIVYYRFDNIGYKNAGPLALLTLIPLVNIIVGYRCLVLPKGYAETKVLDQTGKVLSWLFIALIILIVVAMLIPAIHAVNQSR